MSLIAWVFAAYAADLDVTSKVSEVTVYVDRARITRSVTVDVPAGRTDLVFDDLPIQLLPASLAAEGEGSAGATLTGIDLRPERGIEDRDARVAKLRSERRVFEDRVAQNSDVVSRLHAEIAFLGSLSPVAPPALEPGVFLAKDVGAQMAGLSSRVGADLRTLYAELRAVEQATASDNKEIARIDREIAQLASDGSSDAMRVAVGLDAAKAGKVTIRLAYVVTGAGWVPHYDARFQLADASVKLDLSGEVHQSTGEDWTDVRLILSTAAPQQGTAPPRLDPFWLQEQYYRERDGYAEEEGMYDSDDAGMALGSTAIADRVTAFEFTATRAEDVPADGTVRRVFLTSLAMNGDVIHEVVARKVESAYLTSKVTNTAEFALMAGSVSSYLGTAYVGEGRMGVVAPGEKTNFSFGVDDRVKVERRRVDQTEAAAKPLGNRERKKYAWKTKITNRTGKAIQVKVSDQIPATRDAAFKVEPALVPDLTIGASGVFWWDAKIADGKDQEFVTAYEVSWPEGDRPNLME